MREIQAISGRDVKISIDGKQILQAESAEIRVVSDIHKVRTCFCNDDNTHIRGKKEYKAVFTGLKFKKPFENFNFYDLDNFTTVIAYENVKITLKGCIWSDLLISANKAGFRERIGITALRMNLEETE